MHTAQIQVQIVAREKLKKMGQIQFCLWGVRIGLLLNHQFVLYFKKLKDLFGFGQRILNWKTWNYLAIWLLKHDHAQKLPNDDVITNAIFLEPDWKLLECISVAKSFKIRIFGTIWRSVNTTIIMLDSGCACVFWRFSKVATTFLAGSRKVGLFRSIVWRRRRTLSSSCLQQFRPMDPPKA